MSWINLGIGCDGNGWNSNCLRQFLIWGKILWFIIGGSLGLGKVVNGSSVHSSRTTSSYSLI